MAVDDVYVHGKLTLGEDVADLCGLILAYRAWKPVTGEQASKPSDALSPEQRLFVDYAQWACANVRPARSLLLTHSDPHSPPKYRVNGLGKPPRVQPGVRLQARSADGAGSGQRLPGVVT